MDSEFTFPGHVALITGPMEPPTWEFTRLFLSKSSSSVTRWISQPLDFETEVLNRLQLAERDTGL